LSEARAGTTPPPGQQLLKRDLFGAVLRIRSADGTSTTLRDLSAARGGLRWFARYLGRREVRALQRLQGITGVPAVLQADRHRIVRSWIEGLPMQVARPRDPAYFVAAMRLLRALHARDVAHNDLAKEPNWLVTTDGGPALVDFQLALCTQRRSRLFRALAHDDLRHLLKHKRTYVPERLTARERRILATPSLVSRLWMATGKRVYRFVTRRLLHWSDREGAGDRGL
jgi:RIO-like serine/threonine protein kinase